jgi:hypothetical protein
MNPADVKALLEAIQAGTVTPDQGLDRLRDLPYEDAGFALIDHHRALRQRVPETILGEGKTPEQIASIVASMAARGQNVFATRLSAEKGELLDRLYPHGEHDPLARTFTIVQQPLQDLGRGPVAVVCAGTSDLPVAREAANTARIFQNRVIEIADVGVAGLHRLLAHLPALREAAVIIVVAGMEGALPSVIGGLVSAPVIAVPTSVGYGAAFNGIAALLGMLNSCAGGVTVVNIDNGFGAAFAATRINRRPDA